jgi:hypothetical protein
MCGVCGVSDPTLTYTIKSLVSGLIGEMKLQAKTGGTGNWVDLPQGATFTQADVDNGNIRITASANPNNQSTHFNLGSFTLTVNDGTSDSVPTRIDVLLRVPYEQNPSSTALETLEINHQKASTTLPGSAVSSAEADPKLIKTGIGDTTIKPGSGDDVVEAGLGDDVVDLSRGGTDKVIYRFTESQDGRIFAWDGGDLILGFTPGEDRLQFNNLSGHTGATTTPDAFVNKLGTGFEATFNFQYKNNGASKLDIVNFNVTEIEIHFAGAVLLPGSGLSGSILTIRFDVPIDWTMFKQTWLAGNVNQAVFDETTLRFKPGAATQTALEGLLGLSVGKATERHVAIGDDGDNVITIAPDSGDWVVFGGPGDDTVNLSNGAEELVQLVPLEDDDALLQNGNDIINNFTLGVDRLHYIHTDEHNAGSLPTQAQLVSLTVALTNQNRYSVALKYDGTEYTSIILYRGVGNLTINLADASKLTNSGLKTRLGVDDTQLASLLTGGIPAGAKEVAFTTAGLDYIDELFDGPDFIGIGISATLPVELL